MFADSENEDKKLLLQLTRDQNVKDLTQKLINLPTSPTSRATDFDNMTGLISKAKEELAKSKSKGEVNKINPEADLKKPPEPMKSENELQWEEIVKNINRDLILCDMDFTDLTVEDETYLPNTGNAKGLIPPPPPPNGMLAKTTINSDGTSKFNITDSTMDQNTPKVDLTSKTKKTVNIV